MPTTTSAGERNSSKQEQQHNGASSVSRRREQQQLCSNCCYVLLVQVYSGTCFKPLPLDDDGVHVSTDVLGAILLPAGDATARLWRPQLQHAHICSVTSALCDECAAAVSAIASARCCNTYLRSCFQNSCKVLLLRCHCSESRQTGALTFSAEAVCTPLQACCCTCRIHHLQC
jgi:hypothetical protein